ncbi:MAG: hypothetical protein BME94_02390 [Methanobacteriales archaeon Met13]
MTALELFAILVLAGAVIVLLYYYLKDNRSLNLGHIKSDAMNLGETVRGGASDLGEKISGGSSMQGMGEKLNVSGVGEKVSGVGATLKGKVREVPISTDVLSGKIDMFLNEKSDQLIDDWELATKKDLSALEGRYKRLSTDLDSLENRFKEFKGYTSDKLEEIDQRLEKLENPEEKK